MFIKFLDPVGINQVLQLVFTKLEKRNLGREFAQSRTILIQFVWMEKYQFICYKIQNSTKKELKVNEIFTFLQYWKS